MSSDRAPTDPSPGPDSLERLASLDAPTADIEQMLAEIEAGRGSEVDDLS